MKIAITGGAGFIGSQFYQVLKQEGCDVQLIDNMSFGYFDNLEFPEYDSRDLVIADIRDDIGSLIEGVDALFHFAGISALPQCQVNPASAYDHNVTGYANVLELARRHKVRRVILSSTSAVYENTSSKKFEETDPIDPDLIYACSKAAAEQLSVSYASCYGLDVVNLRFFNVYGDHQDIHRPMPPFLSYLAKEIYYGRTPIIYNKSSALRDYIHITDVIQALKCIAAHDQPFGADCFNICSGIGHSVQDIIDCTSTILERKIEVEYRDPSLYWEKYDELDKWRPIDKDRVIKEVTKHSIGENQKIVTYFGLKSQVSLQDGISSLLSHSFQRLKKQ